MRGSAERQAKPITTFDMKEAVEVSCSYLRNEFHFSGVHGAMNRSGSRAK